MRTILTPNFDQLGDGKTQQLGYIIIIICQVKIMKNNSFSYTSTQEQDDEWINDEMVDSGIKSVLSKYKSKSFMEAYPNSFQQLSISPTVSQYRSALYCGNSSDLWQYFNHCLKREFKKIDSGDLRILRIITKFAQQMFLQRTIQKIPKSQEKDRLMEKCKQFETTFLNNKEGKMDIIYLLQNQFKKQSDYCQFLKKANKINLQLQTIPQKIDELFNKIDGEIAIKFYHSAVDFVLRKRMENRISNSIDQKQAKRDIMMKLMSLHLVFTLKNEHWSKIALSGKILPQMKIYDLSEPKGTNSLIYFYNDAPEKVLQGQFENFSKLFGK